MELSKYCKYTTSRIDPASLNVDNYISTENMMQNKGGVTAASKVPMEKAVEYKPGDILISNIRPYFKKIWLADRSGGCSSDVLCIRALKGTDSVYLYYLLSQDSFFDYVMSGSKGSKMPRGDKSQIMKWDVDLPGIDEQRRIGQALKIIDDKIAINNRINHNLEEQSQALYKSWFVDFEPFKDDKFVDSELGMIPEGWKVLPFSAFVQISNEKVDSKHIPEFSVTNTGIFPRDAKFNKRLSSSSLTNKVIRKGDLVFGMSREILNWGIMDEVIGGVSSAYTVYKIEKHIIDENYLRSYIQHHIGYFKDLIKPAAREGQGIDKKVLASKMAIIPEESIWNGFQKKVNSIIAAKRQLMNQTEQLAKLRDEMLPILMGRKAV